MQEEALPLGRQGWRLDTLYIGLFKRWKKNPSECNVEGLIGGLLSGQIILILYIIS